jgi:inorganic pyrophosphatase
MHGLQNVPRHTLREIDYFFHIYKELEDKSADTYGWKDRVDAYRIIEESIARYD